MNKDDKDFKSALIPHADMYTSQLQFQAKLSKDCIWSCGM
jgi:hypothetical protein